MNPRKIVPDWFEMPSRIEFDDCVLIPVTSKHWVQDHDAVVSTYDYLHGGGMNPGLEFEKEVTSSPKFGWMDACWLERHWQRRTAVCYGLMTPDERRELGCLYIFPSYKQSYDADVFCWVRDEERKNGLNEKLYRFAEEWVPKVWPLKKISWPGRNISWEDWYAMPEKDPQPLGGKHAYVTSPRNLVPDSFTVPTHVETSRFVLVPLTLSMETVTLDHKYYFLNKDYIREIFMPNTAWPDEMSLLDTIVEISAIELDWFTRSEFVYSIRTPGESDQIGRLYIQPTRKMEFEAEAHFWVGARESEMGLEKEINKFVHMWISEIWPFNRVAWPGRDITWDNWNNLPDLQPDPS